MKKKKKNCQQLYRKDRMPGFPQQSLCTFSTVYYVVVEFQICFNAKTTYMKLHSAVLLIWQQSSWSLTAQ